MSQDFTYDAYDRLLRALQANWRLGSFRDCRAAAPETRVAALRHDVDISLDAAVALAEIEAEAGVSSTYCLRLGGTFYDPLRQSGIVAVRRLLALGHEIGLHFDIERYGALGLAPDAGIDADLSMLRQAFGEAPALISQHSPARVGRLDLRARPDLERLFAYNAYFVGEMKYISDSGQYWREGGVTRHVRAHRLHVLTHPEWWTAAGDDRDAILQTLSARAQDRIAAKAEVLRRRYDGYVDNLQQSQDDATPGAATAAN